MTDKLTFICEQTGERFEAGPVRYIGDGYCGILTLIDEQPAPPAKSEKKTDEEWVGCIATSLNTDYSFHNPAEVIFECIKTKIAEALAAQESRQNDGGRK